MIESFSFEGPQLQRVVGVKVMVEKENAVRVVLMSLLSAS